MEQLEKSRWEGNEHWFKFDHNVRLRRICNISSLGSTETAVALRTIKYQLEKEFGFEITDELFVDIFRNVCNIQPVPALGMYAPLAFIQPFQNILEKHGVPKKEISAIWRTFRLHVDNPRCYKNILLHVPHSSSSFPSESMFSFTDLDNEEKLLIDYYTDELFVPQQDSAVISNVVFPYCRLYCDVERLINDPLEKDGLGISYFREIPTGRGCSYTYRSFCSKEEAFNRYVDFHASVSKRLFTMGDDTLLIDCHSFSNLPTLLCSNPPDIDICIGYNDDETSPDKVAIGNIIYYFQTRGYKVGVNSPFSNSKTFNVPVKYHSVMIEVNKRLYMDEQTLEKSEGFYRLQYDIWSLYDVLLRRC